MPDSTQDQATKVNTMTRTEMDQDNGFVSYPTGIIIAEDGFPLLNEDGQQQFLDLSDEEIASDLKQELKRLFIEEYEDYITDNDLVSIRKGYGYGKYMSVDGYIDSAEEKLGAEFGVIENYLQSVIAPLDEEYEKNEIYRIDETAKPYENYIEKQMQLHFGEYIDSSGNIELRDDGEVSLSKLIEMTKAQVIQGFHDRSETLDEEADYINERHPISQDVEVPLSQNPEEWIERLNSDDITIDEKRALYVEIQSSARHSERNLVSLAILPVAQSLASSEIQTDANPSFKNQMRMALEIVNNDFLVGVIPDYVKTAVLSMDTASRIQASINDKKNTPAENGRRYSVDNIDWDEDEGDAPLTTIKLFVPNELTDEDKIQEYISNKITELTEYTHNGFSYSRMGEAYEQHLSVGSPLTTQRKTAIINLNLNNYFDAVNTDETGFIIRDESGIPILKTEEDILDELRDVDFGDNYVSDSYDESLVSISEVEYDSNGLPMDIVTSSNVNLEYHFPVTMSDEDIEEALENIELPSNYVEDTYELNNILVEDGTPTLTYTNPIHITAHINLGYYYDPSMTKGEIEADLENIELPTGYKPNSFKFKKLKDNGVDSNGVQNEKMAICSIEMDFVFPADTPYEELRRDIELICRKSIPGEYKITELDGVNQPQTKQASSFDVEADFEDPWHEYHIATRPTEDQLLSARVALKRLKINAAKNDTDSLIALASIYESGVRDEFKKELFDYSEYSEKMARKEGQDSALDLSDEGYEKYLNDIAPEDRMIINESLLKQASKGNNEQAKLKFLNARYERAKTLETGTFYSSKEVFEILLENAESGHVPSMLSVAEKYRVGHGVDSSAVEHEKWYLLAKKGLDSGKVVYSRDNQDKSATRQNPRNSTSNKI